jgi:periplasmic mercuric ion binding protein
MKTLKLLCVAILLALISSSVYAQSQENKTAAATKTESYKVWGNCEMCKTRIEKAAKIDGVAKADWNEKTQMLALVYNPSKVNSDDVLKKIAAAGHDTEKFKGDDKAYSKLPACCKYERKK